MLKLLDKYPIEEIDLFLETRKSKVLPDRIQKYLVQINSAMNILEKNGNIRACARELTREFPGLNFNTAITRANDAIAYNHRFNTVKNEYWDS